ncbi:hypothetical protein [Winogradskyella sp.]|uniref:hypothetical protein n=1 Tax=Winogradskyella sp. TaxID=1883156 RepID=UPI00263848E5|nr:hypothetical protein [Winogradskyella sp.]
MDTNFTLLQKQSIKIILISCALVLFGRFYQFYFFGSPYRAFLWDESLLTPIVLYFYDSWNAYATDPTINYRIELLTKIVAVIFLITSFIALFWFKVSSMIIKKSLIWISFVFLIFMALSMFKEKNYSWLPVFELSIQLSPIVLLAFWKNIEKLSISFLTNFLKIAIALTFIPHGLFAMGILPVPGHFIDMTISILKISEDEARIFLWVVGFIDVLGSILIFIPHRMVKFILYYFAFWGFVTAFARVYVGFIPELAGMTLHNSLFLTIYRLPHGLIPLATLYLIRTNKLTVTKNEKPKLFNFGFRFPSGKHTESRQ